MEPSGCTVRRTGRDKGRAQRLRSSPRPEAAATIWEAAARAGVIDKADGSEPLPERFSADQVARMMSVAAGRGGVSVSDKPLLSFEVIGRAMGLSWPVVKYAHNRAVEALRSDPELAAMLADEIGVRAFSRSVMDELAGAGDGEVAP